MHHLEHVLIEVIALGDLPVKTELNVPGHCAIESVGVADREKFTLLL